MKLYATTTSERATKGQGGNEYLQIVVKGEDERSFLELEITHDQGFYNIFGYVIHPEHEPGHRTEQYIKYSIKKGNKKKTA